MAFPTILLILGEPNIENQKLLRSTANLPRQFQTSEALRKTLVVSCMEAQNVSNGATYKPDEMSNASIPAGGEIFPDFELLNHKNQSTRLSDVVRVSDFDQRLGFSDGYPVIVVFYRGFFCPKDQRQMRNLVEYQDELAVTGCSLISVAVQPPLVQAAFAAGLGARWTFCADENRAVIESLGLLDTTEGEFPRVSRPYTFVLTNELRVHSAYDGWYFVGRPSIDELRRDLRDVMRGMKQYPYDVWTAPEVAAVRVPAEVWEGSVKRPGEDGSPTAEGAVTDFDLARGVGTVTGVSGERFFFHFTAIPGTGYRTIAVGTRVVAEVVEGVEGRSLRNVQPI